MSIEFGEIIDKEMLELDCERLVRFNDRAKINTCIDNLVDDFVDEKVPGDDYETITLLYTLANKIKKII